MKTNPSTTIIAFQDLGTAHEAVQRLREVVRTRLECSHSLRTTETHTTQLLHRLDVVIHRGRCRSEVLVSYRGQMLCRRQ